MAVGLNRLTLSVLGLWPPSKSEWRYRFKNAHVLSILGIIILVVLLPHVYALALVIDHLPLVIDNLMSFIAASTSAAKLFFLWLNMSRMSPILTTIAYDWFKLKDNKEREIMWKLAQRGRTFTIGGYVIMVSCCCGILFAPMFGFSIRTINNITDYGDHFLPMQTYYPYDFAVTPYYEISYFLQLLASVFCGMGFTSPVNFFGVLIFHTCGQLEILGMKMKKLQIRRNKGELWSKTKKRFAKNIKKLVDSHTHMIRTVEEIENTFTMVILVQLIGLTVIMCCLGFQFLNAIDANTPTNITQIIVIGGTFLNMMLHTFVYCLAGETLAYHSGKIHEDIYNSEWNDFPPKMALDICHILVHSNEPIQLKAGYYIALNLETYCSILKSSAGYLSMLVAVRDKTKL